jgi:signal transduction histidine kinase
MNSQTISRNVWAAPRHLPFVKLYKVLLPGEKQAGKPDQFASLAHEIRNPLSTINLSAEMLRSIITDKDQKKFLEMIIRGSMRINDILTNVHAALRTTENQPGKYSIHQLLDEVLVMAGDQMTLKNITIRKNYAAKDFKTAMNRSQMKIALTNIIINAIEAMAPGKGEFKLVTKSTGHSFVVEMQDNGCGISQKNLRNIFKPYFTNKPGGLGIGLTTTRDILRANRVRMSVKSEETKGTSFILVFGKETSLR